MLLNDTLLKDVNGFKLLINKDARLVYQTNDGTRYMFPLQSGSEYQAGNGLILSGSTFFIDSSIIPDKNEVSGMISGAQTNQQLVKIDPIASDYTFTLEYDPNYEIFVNEVTLSSNVLEIEPISFTNASLQNNQVATFESWIKTTNNENINTISIDSSIVIVDEIPVNLSGTLTHVFARRVYKDGSGNIHEKINYTYSF